MSFSLEGCKNKDYNEIEYIKNLELKSDSRILIVAGDISDNIDLSLQYLNTSRFMFSM